MVRQAVSLRYLPEAQSEYSVQIEYYDNKAPGLGRLFVQAIQAAENLARSTPSAWPLVPASEDLRSVVVRRFPFRLLYALRGGSVIVVALAHTARHPRVFVGR